MRSTGLSLRLWGTARSHLRRGHLPTWVRTRGGGAGWWTSGGCSSTLCSGSQLCLVYRNWFLLRCNTPICQCNPWSTWPRCTHTSSWRVWSNPRCRYYPGVTACRVRSRRGWWGPSPSRPVHRPTRWGPSSCVSGTRWARGGGTASLWWWGE